MSTSGGSDGGDTSKVVDFPKTAEERRALRKAKDDLEKQRLVDVFIDEAGPGVVPHSWGRCLCRSIYQRSP